MISNCKLRLKPKGQICKTYTADERLCPTYKTVSQTPKRLVQISVSSFNKRFLINVFTNIVLLVLGGAYMILIGQDEILSHFAGIAVFLKILHKLCLAIAYTKFHPSGITLLTPLFSHVITSAVVDEKV